VRARLFPLLAFVAALAPTRALAIEILYDLQPLGGDSFRIEYTVVNDGSLGVPVEWFQVQFDPALYDESSLVIDSDPSLPAAGWDEVLLASGIALPAAYDVFSDTTSIPVGTSLAGSSPGAQPFGILDPELLDFVEMGTTTPIPEPGTGMLVGWGFVIVGLGRRLRERRASA
jgi:hypothetical protein